MLPLQQAQRVLVFAPHPDDESIGCGGLLVRLVEAGVPVHVVLVTDGGGAGGLPAGAAALRQEEFLAALHTLGVKSHAMLGFEDGALDRGAALRLAVASQVQAFAPNWVLSPSPADAHRDHRCVAHAVQQAALASAAVQWMLQYETWSALPISHVLDVSEQMPKKMAALAQHHTALAQMDYAAAASGLARYRALLLQPGRRGGFAEGFLATERSQGFSWPAGWGRPEGWESGQLG